jgi:hypothetical protein
VVRRLILHIGLPKTGSSAVQAYLSDNSDRLARCGYGWLPGGRGPNMTELAVAFTATENATTRRFLHHDQDRRRWRARVSRSIRRALDHHRQVIVSSEHLAALLRTPDETRALAGFLGELADEVLVVGVVRRADYWLPSDYAEAVRGGRDIKQSAGFVQRRAHLLDHESLLERWTSAFGRPGVRLIPFLETDKADPAAVSTRFLEATGMAAADTAGWSRPARLTRSGLSAEAAEVLRRINPQLGLESWHSGAERERLIALLAERHPGPGAALTPAARHALRQRHWIKTGVDRSQHAFGERWDGWSTAPPAPVASPPEVDDSVVGATLRAVQQAGFGKRHPIMARVRRAVQRIRH